MDFVHPYNRSARTSPLWAVAVIVILIVGMYFVYNPPAGVTIPKLNSAGQHNNTATNTTTQQLGACTNAPIQSLLSSWNKQAISSGTVSVYQQVSGNYNLLPSASTSETLNTYNTASAYYSLPWVTVWNASSAYPATFSPTQAPYNDGAGNSIACSTPAGSNNNVLTFQQNGLLYLAPASGRTATTNVESVINSISGQTNSLPASMPTSAPVSVTVYLQGFANNIIANKPVQIPGSVNAPITDYGGVFCNGIQELAQSTQVKNQLVCYQSYVIVAFNQTSVALTATNAIPINVNGVTGVKAWAIPVTSSGVCNASGVSTTAPCTLSQVTYQIQETTAFTTHHVDMYVLWTDVTQLGYIQQYFTTPAAGSFLAAANAAGLGSGFSGAYPPSGSNAPDPQIIQHSSGIMAY